MEKWDAYTLDGKLAGFDLVRGEPIPKGFYHLVAEVLVRHVDGSYLLMQRDFNKESHPGMFEATSGGSVLKGETPYEAAKRELFEETGITALELKQINKSNSQRAIFYSYLCVTDCKKDSIKLQEGETIGYRWVSKEEIIDKVMPGQKERLLPYINGQKNKD